MIYLRCRG